ncbi:helix-turn-helix domain-containing protein [Natronosporangium hydrolyticum]|uniref:helix-turn-helix domain-containing protein n=1 Tax=Natronosporangium hydrolyticum TaxID=2811111 RepID=UPI003B845A0D
MLDVPRELVHHLARLLTAERRTRGTRRRTRALTCFKQALLVLVWYRKREDLTLLAAGFGISRATAYRYRDEATNVLADGAQTSTRRYAGSPTRSSAGSPLRTRSSRPSIVSEPGFSEALTTHSWPTSSRLASWASRSRQPRYGSIPATGPLEQGSKWGPGGQP